MCLPKIPTSGFIFMYTNTPSRTVQTHLTTLSITLFQLTPSALGIQDYPSDVPHAVKTYWKIDRWTNSDKQKIYFAHAQLQNIVNKA